MKQFKDLDITGPDEQLLASVREVSTNLPTKWRRNPEAEPGRTCGGHDVPGAGCLPQRVLRVAWPWALSSCAARRGAARHDPHHPPAISGHLRGASGSCRATVAGGCRVSRKRVARLMREVGLAGVSRRRGTRTTRVDASHRAAPDRVERQFQADAPDRIWVADITYVPTCAGFVYLAIVLDVFSRPRGDHQSSRPNHRTRCCPDRRPGGPQRPSRATLPIGLG